MPQELQEFAKFDGVWESERLPLTLKNASSRDMIRVDIVKLSSTNAGFATILPGQGGMKMRICLHESLNDSSRYGVLLHELAHIYLGHLGGDKDGWWPSRGDLARRAMEVEAEAAAFIVSRRAGLQGASPQYVSRYLDGDATLKAVSLDQIAKVAGRLEEMGTRVLAKHRQRRRPRQKHRWNMMICKDFPIRQKPLTVVLGGYNIRVNHILGKWESSLISSHNMKSRGSPFDISFREIDNRTAVAGWNS